MTRVAVTASGLEIEQRTGLWKIFAIVFLALGGLNLAAVVVRLLSGTPHAVAGALGAGLSCAAAGFIFGRMPGVRQLVAARASNELVFVESWLFGKRLVRCPLAEVTAVRVNVLTYWNVIELVRRDAASVAVMSFSKKWTWETVAGAAVLGHAQKMASFFGVPLDGLPPRA
jgi:hypothetical protein